MKIKTRLVLTMDWLTQPITEYLAFESQLKDMEALIPPKHHDFILEVRNKAKCLPKYLRGAFLYKLTEALKFNGYPRKDVLEIIYIQFVIDYNLESNLEIKNAITIFRAINHSEPDGKYILDFIREARELGDERRAKIRGEQSCQ